MITADEIVTRIRGALPDAQVSVQDTGGGDHWSAVVVSAAFEGKSRVQQHQMVQAPLRDKIQDNSIHALQLRTLTPAQAAQG